VSSTGGSGTPPDPREFPEVAVGLCVGDAVRGEDDEAGGSVSSSFSGGSLSTPVGGVVGGSVFTGGEPSIVGDAVGAAAFGNHVGVAVSLKGGSVCTGVSISLVCGGSVRIVGIGVTSSSFWW